ncbi:hypothetical protein HPB52_008709 [Rhipicephalus sanguineus]|uniref:Uncharacterized protein n=1 Tax=Rhipicephalus sanguineus TaxID=34632 RepID=A0A9D4SWA5_RHISA|nr:hypothetical protein HPB52_008709 [Rhipicephalus sanguineus]
MTIGTTPKQSEYQARRQARYFGDCLRFICLSRTRHGKNSRAHAEWCRTTDSLVEFLWNSVRPTLPRKKKCPAPKNDVVVLGGHTLPDRHRSILELGPKFCFEPQLTVLDKIALSRRISHRVPDQERPSCQKTLVSALDQFPGVLGDQALRW